MNPVCIHTPAVASPGNNLIRSAAFIIPTFNAASFWPGLQAGVQREGIAPDQVLIIDSSSQDDTQELAKRAGYGLKVISRESFRHGATRQIGAEIMRHAEILVYLTQDATPAGETPFERLIEAFLNPQVGAAYGRQLPRREANAIERHARLFNYPARSVVRDFERRHDLGIKAAFFSNSFAAYRRIAFDEVGGFPKLSIVSEEVTVVARMLMKGWKTAYQADATVIHSHPLTVAEEFSRYFDIGVHHGREAELIEAFGAVSDEGRRFVISEMKYLRKHNPALLPLAILRTCTKLFGYQLGKREAHMPLALKTLLSAQPNYWYDEQEHAVPLQSDVVSRTF